MYAEIFDLVQWDRLILRCYSVWWRVVLWISPEGTDIDLASRNGTVGVNLIPDQIYHKTA